MSDPLRRLAGLKALQARLDRDAGRAAGEADALLRRLREEFGADGIQEAERLLRTMDKEMDEAEAAFRRAEEAWRQKWAEKMEGGK